MNLRFLPLIWVVAALIAIPTWGQTIIPNPRPGAVLWTKTVTNMTDGSQLYLSADGRSAVVGIYGGPNNPWVPQSLDVATQDWSSQGSADRLAGRLVCSTTIILPLWRQLKFPT